MRTTLALASIPGLIIVSVAALMLNAHAAHAGVYTSGDATLCPIALAIAPTYPLIADSCNSYALAYTYAGNTYIADYNLTSDDCAMLKRAFPPMLQATCKPE